MAVNPGFEEDFVNAHGEPHVLSFKGDWFYNQKDNIPDFWGFKGDWKWETTEPHSGQRGLTLGANAIASRRFPMAVSQSGGGPWGGAKNVNMKCQVPERFPRTIRASVWCRGGGKIVVKTNGGQAEAACSEGTQGWQRIEAILAADQQKPGIQTFLDLSLQGPGTFDDVSLTEDLSDTPNLAANASFEELDGNGYPEGWSPQRKYSWLGPTYYVWTDWNHYQSANRGGVVSDSLVARSGERSLRFDVCPGDEKYVESEPIALNQDKPMVIEVGVMVRTDRIRLIDIRAVDEQGDDLPSYRPMSPEYGGGGSQIYGCGTFGWRYVRKFIGPRSDRPIKSLRVRLCARGFNAHTLDDGGTRPFCIQVGTVWWDDLRVVERESTAAELAARGVKAPKQPALAEPEFRVKEIGLGDRLYGANEVRLTIRNTSRKTLKLELEGKAVAYAQPTPETGTAKAKVKAGESADLAVPYTIEGLVGDFDRQGSLSLVLRKGKKELASVSYAFNTWPVILDFDLSKHYSHPAENPLEVAINFGVAKATLQQVAKLEIAAKSVSDGKALVKKAITDLAAAFAETQKTLPDKPSYSHGYPTPFWWVDKANLLSLSLDISALKVWPQDEPTRDTLLEVTAFDKRGEVLFQDRSQAFGRVQKYDRNRLPEIKSVKVREDGAVLINGEPKFLTGATHQQQRFRHTNDKIADLGFVGHRLVGGLTFQQIDEMWTQHRLYALQAKPVEKMGTTAVVTAFNDAQRQAFKAWVAKGAGRNVVSYNTGGWESMVDVSKPDMVKSHVALNDELRKLTGRLIAWSPSGAYNAWWLPKVPFYDIVHGETEMWGAMDYNVVWTPYQRHTFGRPCAWLYLPQLYENHPIERLRFETYENILRGSAGYSMIQGIGDPTFLRGLNGELRYLESRWYSEEKPPKTTASPAISIGARRKSKRAYIIATNSGPVQVGLWKWEDVANTRKKSHSGDSINRMWKPAGGWTLHGWRVDTARLIGPKDKIVQYVRIDPDAPPKCVVLGVRGNGKFIHNIALGAFSFKEFQDDAANLQWFTELNHSTWHSVWLHLSPEKYAKAVRLNGQKWADRYKSISDQHKKHVDEHTYRAEHFKNLGALPKAGEWHRIEVAAADIGLVGKWLDGVCFATKGGKALWDTTMIVSDGQEVMLCDDSVGIDRALLDEVRFEVEGLKPGARIRVLFEAREIAASDGYFVDNFQGTDTYGLEWQGVTGDNFGYIKDEARDLVNVMPSGYGYNYGPTAVHIYEIPIE